MGSRDSFAIEVPAGTRGAVEPSCRECHGLCPCPRRPRIDKLSGAPTARSSGDPAIDCVENEQRPDDNPPRLVRRRRILFRDVVAAIGATFRFLVNLASTIGARNGGFHVVGPVVCSRVTSSSPLGGTDSFTIHIIPGRTDSLLSVCRRHNTPCRPLLLLVRLG
jgi:hypothetical protein